MENLIPITNLQYLLPPVCTGILFSGFLLFLYLSVRYSSRLYFTITLMGFFALVFVGSEMMILTFGGLMRNAEIGRLFHRTEHLAGVFFLLLFPLFVSTMLTLTPSWMRINRVLVYFGLGIALVITAAAFIQPDLFISINVAKESACRYEADFGRGREGILYQLRDVLLAVGMTYFFICMSYDLFRKKNYSDLIGPFAALFFVMFCAVVDIVFVYKGFNIDFFPDKYFSRFSLGLTVFIMTCMGSLTRKYISSAREVERMHKVITVSEKKYRLLVEGTGDCIFTLDENLAVKSVNNAMRAVMRMPEDSLVGTPFFSLLYSDEGSGTIAFDVVREKISDLMKTGKAVEFKMHFKSRNQMEPVELGMRMEVLAGGNNFEIIGKASSVGDDALLKFFDSERQKFVIGNYLVTAEDISNRLVRNLVKYMSHSQVNFVRIGLREIIVNAIEHGNLNISFDEKTKASVKNNYLEFVVRRQSDPEYRDKKITIDYSLNAQRVIYLVRDDGDGFDYSTVMDIIRSRVNTEMLPHGRGITMAANVFDEIRFNSKGNQVLLVKYFGVK